MLQRVLFWTFLAVFAVTLAAGCSSEKANPPGEQAQSDRHETDRPARADHKRPAPADPYFQAMFADPNDFDLVTGVFQRVAQKCDGADLDQLAAMPEPHRVVWYAWRAVGCVENGGFHDLFGAKIDDYRAVAKAFRVIGAGTAAEAVRDALAIFPDSRPPADRSERLARLERLAESQRETLEQCAATFLDADRDTKRKIGAYVRANREAFAALPPHRDENLDAMRRRNLPQPGPDAYSADVARWLESIGAHIRVAAPTAKGEKEDPAWIMADLPGRLRGGAHIVAVCLAGNRITTDEELRSLVCMEVLREAVNCIDLNGTYVSEAGLAALRELPNLRALSLRNTDATDAWLPRVAVLPKLEELNLAGTPVSEEGLDHLRPLTKLRILDLPRTEVSGPVFAHLAKLPSLEMVCLGRTAVDDDCLVGIAQMPRLRSVELYNTKITDEALQRLSKVTTLEEIDVTSTRVGDLGVGCLRTLVNLRRLELGGTQVKDEGLAQLQGLTKLTFISLGGSDVTDAGVRRFQAALPRSDVRWK
jgi:hypothetical protein